MKQQRPCDKESAGQRPGSSGHGALAVRHGRPGAFSGAAGQFLFSVPIDHAGPVPPPPVPPGYAQAGPALPPVPSQRVDSPPSQELLGCTPPRAGSMPRTLPGISSASRSFLQTTPLRRSPSPTPTAWLRPCVSRYADAYALVFALLSLGTTRLRFAPAGAYGPVYELGLTCIPLLLISACLLYLCAYCTDAATVLIFQRRLSRGLSGPIPAADRLFRLHRGFRLASLLCSLAAAFSLCFSLWASRSNLPLTQWEPDFSLVSLGAVEGRGWVPDETYSERVYPDPSGPICTIPSPSTSTR